MYRRDQMAFKNKSQTVPPQTSWFTTMSFSEHFFFENNRPLWSTRTVVPTSAVHVRIFLYGQAGQEAHVLKIESVQEISEKKQNTYICIILGTSLNLEVSAKAFAYGMKLRSSKGSPSPEKGTTDMAQELSTIVLPPPKCFRSQMLLEDWEDRHLPKSSHLNFWTMTCPNNPSAEHARPAGKWHLSSDRNEPGGGTWAERWWAWHVRRSICLVFSHIIFWNYTLDKVNLYGKRFPDVFLRFEKKMKTNINHTAISKNTL